MGLDRRTFLQRAGLGLLTLGLSQTGLSFLNFNRQIGSKINRYYQALAAPTKRKLALLVGINEYAEGENLKGCVTDVELQQELLIHRFGFQPEDIVILTGQEATREAIENTFVEHLIQQAQSSDVIVFHFSGYGSQVKLPINPQPEKLDSPSDFQIVESFVPSDGILPTKKNLAMNNLLLETLMLLARSVSTDQLTLVLDTSYYSTEKPLQGNLRIRSLPSLLQNLTLAELAFQEQLKQKLGKLKPNSEQVPFTGVILRAAKNEQIAVEIGGNSWSAGLFTYALTQYLWQVTPASNIFIALSKTRQQVEQIIGSRQIPIINETAKLNGLAYNLMPATLMGAEGVVTKLFQVDNKSTTAQVTLTGLPPKIVDYYGLNSHFKLISNSQLQQPSQTTKNEETNSLLSPIPLEEDTHRQLPSEVMVQLVAREGLTGTIQLLNKTNNDDFTFQIGQQIQESIRILPSNVTLVVALDQSLEKIERVDATSAFSGLAIIAPVNHAGENFADCLFALVSTQQKTHSNLPESTPLSDEAQNLTSAETKGYGLLWPGGDIIPNTVGKANEAVKSAIQRLTPQLKTLLAAKLWRLTINEGSSGLGVSATLEKIAQTPQPLVYRSTRRLGLSSCSGSSDCIQALAATKGEQLEGIPKLSIGTPIQYRLENKSDRPIYCLLLALDANGSAITLYSPQSMGQSSTSQDNLSQLKQPVIEPGKSIILPQPSGDLYWRVSRPRGLVEVLIICSVVPFKKTLQALAAKQSLTSEQEQILKLPNPLEVAQVLLEDLHTASAVKMSVSGISSDSYALDVNSWATLSFIYQVVE